jgi:uncharacterized phage-associated protein
MKKVGEILSPDKAADFLILECRERGEVLTNLKLQKLLYYAQAWHLVLNNTPLFNEDFQAWVHGPALPSQYQRFKEFEWRPITKEVRPLKLEDESVVQHLKEIVDVFGVETAAALEMMTHNEAPWKQARKELSPDQPSQAVISKESMMVFYKALQ